MAEVKILKELSPSSHKPNEKQKKVLLTPEQKELNLKKQLFREHLQREIEFTKKSLQRGGKEWDDMIKNIKNKELLLEIEDWEKRCWRLLDRKDYRIKLLMQNMEIAEEQHDRMFSMHVALIDYLIDFCKHMIQTTKNVYEAEAYEIISNFYEEKHNYDKATERFRVYYENLMHGDNLISEYSIKDAEEKHTFKKEDIVNENIVKVCKLRDSAIIKINELYQKVEQIYFDLEEDPANIKNKEKMSLALSKKKQCETDLKKTKEMAKDGLKTLMQLQSEFTRISLEYQQKEIQLIQERQLKQANFSHLRSKNKNLSETADQNIQFLATETYNIVKNLEKIAEYGKHLIGVAFSCRKYQTEKEKINPWPEEQKNINIEIKQNPLNNSESSDNSESKIKEFLDNQVILDQIEKIQKFLYRTACCENQCQILKDEKFKLEEENKKYISLIKTCYEQMAYQKIKKHVKTSELLSTLNIEPVVTFEQIN